MQINRSILLRGSYANIGDCVALITRNDAMGQQVTFEMKKAAN
jgi:hypothetical protein